MKEVEVRLYASLRKYQPDPTSGEAMGISLDDKAKLGNFLDQMKIPRGEIAITMVNGNWEKESYLLQDGDRIGLFPPIAGG